MSPQGGKDTCLAGTGQGNVGQLWEPQGGGSKGKSCCVLALLTAQELS